MDPNQQPPQPITPQQPVPPEQTTAQPQPSLPPAPAAPESAQQYQPHMAAFMYEQPSGSQPVPAKKSHKKLILFLVILLVLIGAGGGTGYMLTRKKPTPAPTPTNTIADSPEPNSTSDDAVIKLTNDVLLAEAPTFNIPSAADGWKPDVVNGAQSTNVIVHTGGCKLYYTASTTQKTDGSTDEKGTSDVIAAELKRLQETATVADVVDGTQPMAVKGSTKKLEFKTSAYTVSTQLSEQKVIMSVRQANGYTLGLRFYCPTPAFSADLNTQILDQISINLKLKDGQ